MKWGHFGSFLAIAFTLAFKKLGYRVFAAVVYSFTVPIFYGYPITYLFYLYRNENGETAKMLFG